LYKRLKKFKFCGVNRKSGFFQTRGIDSLGGPQTKTKFTKWSMSLKRLRTAVLENVHMAHS